MVLGFPTIFGDAPYTAFNAPNQNQTPKYWTRQNYTGTVTLYTVPAGKKVYISTVLINNVDVATARTCSLKNGAVFVLSYYMALLSSLTVNLSTPVLFDSGDTIVIATSGGSNFNLSVIGWEE